MPRFLPYGNWKIVNVLGFSFTILFNDTFYISINNISWKSKIKVVIRQKT